MYHALSVSLVIQFYFLQALDRFALTFRRVLASLHFALIHYCLQFIIDYLKITELLQFLLLLVV